MAYAPSRSLRPASIDPDLAIEFIQSSFPGMFPDEPALSPPREGQIHGLTERQPPDGFAWAWAWGHLDDLTAGSTLRVHQQLRTESPLSQLKLQVGERRGWVLPTVTEEDSTR
jgi:hypothetical protein